MKKFIYVIIIALLFSGCYSQKELKQKNPTSYVFNANIQQIKSTVFQLHANRDFELYPDTTTLQFYYDDFDSIHNKNDICFWTLSNNLESKIYYKKGKPLYYKVFILLHLDSISENSTKATAIAFISEICVGGYQIPFIGHGYSRMKKVPPSTIEEYEILLAIGQQLGEKNMPKCIYPDDKRKFVFSFK